jgi:tRNA(fMet)-specific endonuclease VapC
MAQIRYLLDTNICIYIAKHNPPKVRERFLALAASDLAMSIITYGELCFGAEKSQNPSQTRQIIERLAEAIQVEALTPEVGIHYGEIRGQLQKAGTMIGNNDLWIAAHARAKGWTLVSNNLREFERVEGLTLENWV